MGDTCTISQGCRTHLKSTEFSFFPITAKYRLLLLYGSCIKDKKDIPKGLEQKSEFHRVQSQRSSCSANQLLVRGSQPEHRGSGGSSVSHFSQVLQEASLLILALRGICCSSPPVDLILRASIQEGILFGLMILRIHGQRFGLFILKLRVLQQIQVGAFLRNWQSVAFKWATFGLICFYKFVFSLTLGMRELGICFAQ